MWAVTESLPPADPRDALIRELTARVSELTAQVAERRYQHDLHKARCACGRVHVAERPDGLPDAPLSVAPGCRRWRSTWRSSSTCRSSGRSG